MWENQYLHNVQGDSKHNSNKRGRWTQGEWLQEGQMEGSSLKDIFSKTSDGSSSWIFYSKMPSMKFCGKCPT